MAIQVLGTLCVGVAHQPNKSMQKEIAGTEALNLLINFMQDSRNLLIQVTVLSLSANEIASALLCGHA